MILFLMFFLLLSIVTGINFFMLIVGFIGLYMLLILFIIVTSKK
jgi:uncharacterized membrane protein YuzA (DUF378 family)